MKFIGSLAQLVQSICLTSRGSGVRIPQLPQILFLTYFIGMVQIIPIFNRKGRGFESDKFNIGSLAQLVQIIPIFNRKGRGFESDKFNIGSLAQLVQSICLTSRGSGVRIPQLPHQVFYSNGMSFLHIIFQVHKQILSWAYL